MRGYFLKIVWLFALISCGMTSHSSLKEWMKPNGKLKILSTTAMIGDLAAQIAGDEADLLVLIQGNLDPHSYQLVKGDDEKLKFADLIFYNGLGLEHGASLQNLLAKSPHAIGLGDQIRKEHSDRILHEGNQVDPHIWMDVSLFAQIIPAITEALIAKRPSASTAFQQRAHLLQQELSVLNEETKKKLQSIPKEKRYLVTSHDAFNYFTKAYLAEPDEIQNGSWKDRFQAPEGLAPDSQLSVVHIKMIIDHMKKFNLSVIFAESNVSQDSIRKIMQAGREKGIAIRIPQEALYSDAMGTAPSLESTYQGMIKYNVELISKYLRESGNIE